MPRYLININPIDVKRIEELIDNGTFLSFEQFFYMAIRNQLVAEDEGVDSWKESQTRLMSPSIPPATSGVSKTMEVSRTSKALTLDSSLLLGDSKKPMTFQEPSNAELAGVVFWAQYYRFLPLKAMGRLLYNLTKDGPVSLKEFCDTAVGAGVYLHRFLKNRDSSLKLDLGRRLSTSFPKPTLKSRERFAEQYLISRRSKDGLLDGFLARIKFANLSLVEGKFQVALTQTGSAFVSLDNPIMNKDPSGEKGLSNDEINFLILHLHEKVPVEYNHMMTLLEAVRLGVNDRTSLDKAMLSFYQSSLTPGHHQMSQAHVSSMRAGLQSRLIELNLLNIARHGKSVSYSLTQKAESLLDSGPAPTQHTDSETGVNFEKMPYGSQ